MMRALLDRIEQWRFNRQSGIGPAIWPRVLIGLGVLLFSVGLARTAYSLRTRSSLRTDVASSRSEVADLEEAMFIRVEAREAAGENLLGEGIPEGGVPGPILAEVFAILDSVGIPRYEYRIRERLQTNDADEGNRDVGRDDEGWGDDSDVWNDEAWEEDDAETESDDDGEAREATPGLSLYHWKVELILRTPYDRVIEFLSALDETPRHWRTSELELTRDGRRLEATLLLETFTRPVPEEESTVEIGPLAFNNPFRTQQGGPNGGIIPTAPDLRAVMSGTTPRAWIGGEILTTGESVAQWTVEEIDDDGVWIRHTTGHRLRLSVES